MTDLSTTYLGLKLKNPIIVGACNMADDLNQLKRMGAGRCCCHCL